MTYIEMKMSRKLEEFGKKLKTLRTSSKLSDLATFCKKLGSAEITVRKWESGFRLIGSARLHNYLMLVDASPRTKKEIRRMHKELAEERANYVPAVIPPKATEKAIEELSNYVKNFCAYNDCELSLELLIDMKREFKKILERNLET